jgi:hypothetical protein
MFNEGWSRMRSHEYHRLYIRFIVHKLQHLYLALDIVMTSKLQGTLSSSKVFTVARTAIQ